MARTTSLKIPDDLKDRIADLAPRVAQTPHAYMVEAIADRVTRDERREEFLKSAVESAAHFKKTGIAYRLEDVEQYAMHKAARKKPSKPKPITIARSRR